MEDGVIITRFWQYRRHGTYREVAGVGYNEKIVFPFLQFQFSINSSPETGRARHHMGFGFITFGDPASVDKVLAQATHELDGKKDSRHTTSSRRIPLINGEKNRIQ
ncbi:unnamed protein product [Euphydryas editha]|uniref:RRM domain-containing protein n=1 Tax=Euphydryas editha TaxID=104508 RepID=A0AAU9TKJ3_EUPED|nr:unnamed protein product [Euphydryas editha]